MHRKTADALPYTGYIEPVAAGTRITWGSWSERKTESEWMPITLFPYSSGSDYSGSDVEKSNHRVLCDDKHVMRRSVTIIGGHGTYGIAYVGQPTRKIRELCSSLDGYPLLDEDDHSHLEMELEGEAWDDDGRKDFLRDLAGLLDEVDPTHRHDVDELDTHTEAVDRLWHEGCDVYNVNGGSGFCVETGCTVHFYTGEWLKCARQTEPYRGWGAEWKAMWYRGRAKMRPMLRAVARLARIKGATTHVRRVQIRQASKARKARRGW